MQSVAPPQLDAWQRHVSASTAPVAQQPAAATPSPPQTPARGAEAGNSGTPTAPPPQPTAAPPTRPPPVTSADGGADTRQGHRPAAAAAAGPPPPPALPAANIPPSAPDSISTAATPDPAQERSGGLDAGAGPPARSEQSRTDAVGSLAASPARTPAAPEATVAVAGPPPPPARATDAAAAAAPSAPPPPKPEADTGPKVYSSVADLEADRPWGTAAAGRDDCEAAEPQEELRLLSAEESDASAVHMAPGTLAAVFTPILMRKGGGGGGDADEDRMMFTVDATLDQGDPDVVALVFEDPVDASAVLSMLAHVQGFTDKDGVERRVVPMPPGAAAEVAAEQGASLLCMARGFQAKANVRAGRDINGVLSRIAGARWASLISQQQAAHH